MAWQSPDVGQSVSLSGSRHDHYAGHYGALLLAEATSGLAEASGQSSGLYQILENRLVQSGGAHSLVPQTSREEHNLLPQHTDTAPVMHTVTSGRDLLESG